MKKILLYFFLIVVLASCFHDTDLSRPESIHKSAVLDFLHRMKGNTAEENVSKIDALASALDFRHVKTIKSPLGQQVLVVPVSLESIEGEYRKAIFYLNFNSTIEYGQIIGIDPKLENFSSSEKLIEDILNNRSLSFTGKFSVYSVYQDLVFYNSFNNGKININGKVRPGEAKSAGGRTNGCTAWYLTITYFYSDGSRTTTTEYIGTTCDCAQNSTRIGSTMCGGGDSSAGGGGGLPTDPAPGTLGTVTLRNGAMHLVEWQCDDAHCLWVDLGLTVPAPVVEGDRLTYYFLPIAPIDGQYILGPDGLSYTYNAAYMSWVGVKNVENYVTTPCLKSLVDQIRNNDVVGDLQKIFNEVFNNSDEINMLTFTENSNPGYIIRTTPMGPTHFNTDLNTSIMSNASNEFDAIAIYHEIVHAILLSRGMGPQLEQHLEILQNYIDHIAQAGQSLYPSLPISDARAIAMAGLNDIANANPSLFDAVAKKYGLTRAQIAEIAKSYRRDNEAGNVKKGTPCK